MKIISSMGKNNDRVKINSFVFVYLKTINVIKNQSTKYYYYAFIVYLREVTGAFLELYIENLILSSLEEKRGTK